MEDFDFAPRRKALQAADVLFIVFDLTDPKTFLSLEPRFEKLLAAEFNAGKPIVLLGNKCDAEEKVVGKQEIQKLIQS